MTKLNRAAFSRDDVEDAKRGQPAFDLRDYAAGRGLEFLDHGTPAGFRAAVPGREELQSNVLRGMLPGGEGYIVRFLPPWDDFPTEDALADTARMNRWIEQEIRRDPAQYLWVHKRFKTRPPGEPSLYQSKDPDWE